MSNAQPLTEITTNSLSHGTVQWRSPSNIALVKYWGKKPGQIPANPSISFTLQNSYTDMTLQWAPRTDISSGIHLKFYFEGKENAKFAEKIIRFLEGQITSPPSPLQLERGEKGGMLWLESLELTIHSTNSFPHSAGIASSASSMSALALCLCSMEHTITGRYKTEDEFYQHASYLARLASGSAARSVYGGLVTWGEIEGMVGTSDEFASPLATPIHEIFQNYQDAVLIVSKGEKEVSSRAGHALMDTNPYAETRYAHARQNLAQLTTAIAVGDMAAFIEIVENEALTLHSLMMMSHPSVTLCKPNTWEIIARIRTFREKTGLPICFTLDAGPNIHLLYPERIKSEAETFIKEELVVYCADKYWIADKTGHGPTNITHE